jgi:hypothetical protein
MGDTSSAFHETTWQSWDFSLGTVIPPGGGRLDPLPKHDRKVK